MTKPTSIVRRATVVSSAGHTCAARPAGRRASTNAHTATAQTIVYGFSGTP